MIFQRLLRGAQLFGMTCAVAIAGGLGVASATAGGEPLTPVAGGWTIYKSATPPACDAGTANAVYFDRVDCGYGRLRVTMTDPARPKVAVKPAAVEVQFVASDGSNLGDRIRAFAPPVAVTGNTSFTGSEFTFPIRPASNWPAGRIGIRVFADDGVQDNGPQWLPAHGEGEFYFQQLGASLAAETRPAGYEPGQEIPLAGHLYTQDTLASDTIKTDVAGTYDLYVVTSSGRRGPFSATANAGGVAGQIAQTLPREATEGLTAGPETDYRLTVGLEIANARYTHPATGQWAGGPVAAGNVTLTVPPSGLVLENTFVSAVGWVKPGETYPFRVFVKNLDDVAHSGAVVTLPPVDGTTFTRVTPDGGSATIENGTIRWDVGELPARTATAPAVRTLVVEARADTFGQDPEIVWKNISSTATLTWPGGNPVQSTSKGPKVVPPEAQYETARYGFRPFPVVPVDYRDRKHDTSHSAERLLAVINSKDVPGSTYNLFQEMSFGQLHPTGGVPSAAISTATFDNSVWKSPHRQASGYAGAFTVPRPGGVCYGTTIGPLAGSGLHSERIKGGWYQLPGDTGYYGGDADSVANVVQPLPSFIDNACGPIAKAVYDSALIADPEIDYSDYDTDKDGVVDFYMMVFVGAGGHGRSQLSVPPYDNIWPHSSSLEHYYRDAATGLTGYVSDDQLRDNQDRLLWYTDASRGTMTTQRTEYPVYVRVGPYNVNPEGAIEKASVISHEYGHSLGLPDYYSSPGRATYGDWNLMATDKSQHMDVNAKQELGWVVPRVLPSGDTTITNWRDSKINTHRIDWVRPDGTPYTLQGQNVDNGEAYVAKLPGRVLLKEGDAAGFSGKSVWWSQSGNDFNCTPAQGHNFDINLSDVLRGVPAGANVTLRFKSLWDIEWDYDYGFVLTTTDGGVTYTSHASTKGFSTPRELNPNDSACHAKFGNGLTGTTLSYTSTVPTFASDRNPAHNEYPEDGAFTTDEYDISSLAGKESAAVRFSYATDPGLARDGWMIDDVEVLVDDVVVYRSDFEEGTDDSAIYNGGCNEDFSTATKCTAGWQHLTVGDPAVQDHAYYMEMRDRTGFDFNGRDQNDRSVIGFNPGLLLTYTDEASGYGNTGEASDNPPNQTPIDSQPVAIATSPNLDDAAFTDDSGKTRFSDVGWVDNYRNGTSHGDVPVVQDAVIPWVFDFGCLSFDVLRMAGDEIGPEPISQADLAGDVKFTLGAGCGDYDYGSDTGRNRAPTADAQAKPTTADVGEPVHFDGSRSFDDRQSASELSYAWDLDGDGASDATGQAVTHAYARPGSYTATLTVSDGGGLSDTDSVTVTVRGSDLQVTGLSASNTKAKSGDKVSLSATVANTGTGAAPASQTEFLLDGTTVIGVVDTPAIAAGSSVQVSVAWDTTGVRGEHMLRATADRPDAIVEANEANNAATLTVTVRGNRVTNGSFEQSNTAGTGPEGWSSSNGSAGTTSWSDSGTDGSKGASATGNGGSAATGSPSWTSDNVAVVPGEVLDLSVGVSSVGVSSPASVSLVYIGALATVLDTVTAATAPLTTTGFATMNATVTIPEGVAAVRVVLRAFAPTDLATTGTVTFDDVQLFAR
jgi:immune inhibitor A